MIRQQFDTEEKLVKRKAELEGTIRTCVMFRELRGGVRGPEAYYNDEVERKSKDELKVVLDLLVEHE